MFEQKSAESNNQDNIHISIQKTRKVDICNNIQIVIFIEMLQNMLNLIFKLIQTGNV